MEEAREDAVSDLIDVDGCKNVVVSDDDGTSKDGGDNGDNAVELLALHSIWFIVEVLSVSFNSLLSDLSPPWIFFNSC